MRHGVIGSFLSTEYAQNIKQRFVLIYLPFSSNQDTVRKGGLLCNITQLVACTVLYPGQGNYLAAKAFESSLACSRSLPRCPIKGSHVVTWALNG